MTAIEAPTKTIADRCHAALQAALESVERVAPTRWLVRDRRASESSVLVRLVDGFLLLTDDFSFATPPSRWDLLKANANLTGLAKFAAAPGGGLCLRAEIPVQAEGNLPLRISQACGAFAAAQHLTQPAQGNTGVTPAEAAPTDILKLVEAAGWRCSSQKGDVCAVPLETPQGGHTAIVTAPAGAVRVCTELASWDTLSAPCREGLAGMLLMANARLRLARAVVAEDEKRRRRPTGGPLAGARRPRGAAQRAGSAFGGGGHLRPHRRPAAGGNGGQTLSRGLGWPPWPRGY